MELILKNKLDRVSVNNLIDQITIKNVKTIKRLDLSSVNFVDPYGMVVLLQLLNVSTSIENIIYPVPNVASYMVRANFFSHLEKIMQLDKRAKLLRFQLQKKQDNQTMLEITRIESSDDIMHALEVVKVQTSSIIENNLNYDESEVMGFITLIGELLDNIIRHSMSSGYVCAQVYHYPNSQRAYASVCISDTGIGVKRSLIESPHLSIVNCNDKRALKLAIIDEVTSKEKGGVGYYGIKEMLKKFSGSLYVRSGAAELFIDGKGNHTLKNKNAIFAGTQIELKLPQK